MSDIHEFGFNQGDDDFRSDPLAPIPGGDNQNTPTVATMFPDWELFDTLRKHTEEGTLLWEKVEDEASTFDVDAEGKMVETPSLHYRAKGGHLEYNLYADTEGVSYDMWWTLNEDWHLLPCDGAVFTEPGRSYPALLRLFNCVAGKVPWLPLGSWGMGKAKRGGRP